MKNYYNQLIWFLITAIITVVGNVKAEKININFGYQGSGGVTGWNNITSTQASTNGFTLLNMVDFNGAVTTVDIRMVDAFSNGPYRNGSAGTTISTAFSPIYPNATKYNDYIYEGDVDHSVTIRLEGLDPCSVYTVGFFDSYMADNDARRECKYIIGSRSVNLIPNYNVNTVAYIDDVLPNPSGQVEVSLAFGAAPSVADKVCGLAVMTIEKKTKRKINFNFGTQISSTIVSGWNNIGPGEADLNGWALTYAKDSVGVQTKVDLLMVDGFSSGNYLLNGCTTSTAFIPANSNATKSSWFIADSQADQSVKINIEGLTPSEKYNFYFYASNYTSSPLPNYLVKYKIGDRTTTLQPGGNCSNLAVLSDVVPDAFGCALIELNYGAGPEVGMRLAALSCITVEGRFNLPTAEDLALLPYHKKAAGYYGFTDQERIDIANAVQVNTVLPPYKPMAMPDPNIKRFSLTTSQWSFVDSVFPNSINILNDEVLWKNISLSVVSQDSGGTIAPSDVNAIYSDQLVVMEQNIKYPLWTLKLKAELSYDALIVYTARLIPDPGNSVQISNLKLIIPFASNIGKYIRFGVTDASPAYVYGFGPIPRPGEQIELKYNLGNGALPNMWNPANSPDANAVIWEWKDGFLPYFWIGDEGKGIGWIAESDKGWHNNIGDTAFSVVRQGDVVIATVNFVTAPITINSEREIQFAIQAFPPKPQKEDWLRSETVLDNQIEEHMIEYSQLTPEQKATPLEDPATSGKIFNLWWSLWSVGQGSPRPEDPCTFKLAVDTCYYRGMNATPYLALTHLAVLCPEGYYYGTQTKEWAKKPYQVDLDGYEKNSIVRLCPQSFFSEYQAWAIGQMIDKYNITGIYFDNCSPFKCTNTAHGCGYIDDSNTVKPTIPFLAARKFFMMVRNEFIKRGKQPIIYCHSGDFPAELSFVDVFLTGEGVYGLDHTELMTPGEMKASLLGLNQSGAIVTFLPQMSYPESYGTDVTNYYPDAVTRHLLAMTLPHGTKIFPTFCNKMPVLYAWDVFKQLSENSTEFIPYWKWSVNDQLNPQSIYASLYKQSGKAVLAISNISSNTVNSLVIPKSYLDSVFQGADVATDPMDNLPVVLNGNGLTLSIFPKDFRLILLSRTPTSCNDYGIYGIPYMTADLNKDCYINFDDLSIFVSNWLSTECVPASSCEEADINKDAHIDLEDYVSFAAHWLSCNDPVNAQCD